MRESGKSKSKMKAEEEEIYIDIQVGKLEIGEESQAPMGYKKLGFKKKKKY